MAWQLAIATKVVCICGGNNSADVLLAQEVVALPQGRLEASGLAPLEEDASNTILVGSREDFVVARINSPVKDTCLPGYIMPRTQPHANMWSL